VKWHCFALAGLVTLCGCTGESGGSGEDLSKLSRVRQMQALRTSLAKNPGSKELNQKLGEIALEEGDSRTAIEAFEKSGDTKGVSVARLWMDPANFTVPPGTAPELFAAASSVPLAIDSSFATRADILAKLNRAGRLFFEAGDRDSAGKCIQKATPQVNAILQVPQPSLLAYHLAADHDELYGDMLFGNRHWGDARNLYQNNVMRFKNWNPPNDYTRKRLELARKKVLDCEKKMMP
jgi:tetratricopeptide (TPR) repeat protein